MQAKTIDEVIDFLEVIIKDAKREEHPLGYFAALYQQVTKAVKVGIAEGRFQDGARMERLDVIFANRYLKAYSDDQVGKAVTASWKRAFALKTSYWPIVLQHLLVGMNAHINLDLGIAAAEVSKGVKIEDLKHDFDEINTILASLVSSVEEDLSTIWLPLRKILKWTSVVDNFLVNFSMELARDGAWRFATELATTPDQDWAVTIQKRDLKIAEVANVVLPKNPFLQLLLLIIRVGEQGTVAEKIKQMAK